jgi:hypothetical protein
MIRKLETGEYMLERDADTTPPNGLRARDYKAEAQAEENKKALFRKPQS